MRVSTPRSLNCLLNVGNLGRAQRFPLRNRFNSEGVPQHLWWQHPCKKYRQQTGESLHPGRSRSHVDGWARLSPALGVHAPRYPLPCPHPQNTTCTSCRSVFQQVPVQIHEGLVDVARYGTKRSPVRAQQHWHRLLPVAKGDTGALGRESRQETGQSINIKAFMLVFNSRN